MPIQPKVWYKRKVVPLSLVIRSLRQPELPGAPVSILRTLLQAPNPLRAIEIKARTKLSMISVYAGLKQLVSGGLVYRIGKRDALFLLTEKGLGLVKGSRIKRVRRRRKRRAREEKEKQQAQETAR